MSVAKKIVKMAIVIPFCRICEKILQHLFTMHKQYSKYSLRCLYSINYLLDILHNIFFLFSVKYLCIPDPLFSFFFVHIHMTSKMRKGHL